MGVLKQAVTQEVLEHLLNQANALSGGGLGSGVNFRSLLGDRKKAVGRLGRIAERQALREAESDARLPEGKGTLLLDSGKAQPGRLAGSICPER
jgi:hypothetical protein